MELWGLSTRMYASGFEGTRFNNFDVECAFNCQSAILSFRYESLLFDMLSGLSFFGKMFAGESRATRRDRLETVSLNISAPESSTSTRLLNTVNTCNCIVEDVEYYTRS